MATTTTLAPARASRAVTRLATVPFALGAIVVLATVARFALSLERTTPRYLPDEFLYPELARSLGRGDGVTVLGEPSAFPALLEPLLTSVFWRSGDAELAMRLTQALHCLAIALAALPVYAIARRLRLSSGPALACAVVAVVAPGAFFAATLTADALGYLLALVALAAALHALEAPSRRTQVWFLAAAATATFARVQYAILLPAFAIAALVVERGRPWRTARRFGLVFATVLAGCAAALVLGPTVLGRYEAMSTFGASTETATWALSTLLLLALAAGAATAPGALAWCWTCIRRPEDRARASLAGLAASLLLLLTLAAAVMTVETASDRFLERYLILGAPLLALMFACWVDEGRPGRVVAVVGALTLVVVAARVPLSGYTAAQGTADSPTLASVAWLERALDLSTASLVAAGVVTLAAALAAAVALSSRPSPWLPLGAGLALLATISFGAHLSDRQTSETLLATAFAGDPAWVDAAGADGPLLVQTPGSSRFDAMLTIFWNPSIEEAAALGTRNIDPIDGLGRRVAVRRDGTLTRGGEPVSRPVVFALGGTAAAFDGARVTYDRRYALVRPSGDVRVTLLAEGIRHDGKVTPAGRLTVYPTRAGRCSALDVRLTVPAGVPATTLELTADDGSRRRVRVTSASPTRISLTSGPRWASTIRYRTVALGGRPPSPFVATVADAAFSSESVACST